MSEEKETKKPWYKRWWGIGLILVGVLVVIGVLTGSPGEGGPQIETTPEQGAKEYRFPDKPDKQETDIELVIGESAVIEEIRVGFSKVSRVHTLTEYHEAESGKEFVVLFVSLENKSDKTQHYSDWDFRIQIASGQVLDAGYNSRSDALESADLVTGGKVSGTVAFEIPKEEGHQYVLYKPSWDPARIVVQIR